MLFFSDPAFDLPTGDPSYIPPAYSNFLIPGAAHQYFPKKHGHIFSQWIIEKDFQWRQHEFLNTIPDTLIEPFTPRPVIALHFMAKQSIRFLLEGGGAGTMEEGWMILFYVPAGKGHKAWLPVGHSQSQHLNIDSSLVEELAEKYHQLKPLIEHARNGAMDGVQLLPARMDYAVRKILEELHDCPEDSTDRRYYIKARILTLLLFYARDMGHHSLAGFTTGGLTFQPQDVANLYRAEDILLSNEGRLITIQSLSRKVAMNTNHLKKGFKHLFGTTVFRYQNTCRMKRGADLLITTNHSIQDISDILFFEHKNGFIKAFSKYTGKTPARYRRDNS